MCVSLAPAPGAVRAGAEDRILGLDLAQVRLVCPGAMLAHFEKNPHYLAQLQSRKKGKVRAIEMEYTLMRMIVFNYLVII